MSIFFLSDRESTISGGLGRRWRQRPRFYLRLKIHLAVRAVAKGFVFRVPTAAKANSSPAGQIKGVPGRVADCEFSFYPDRSIVVDSDFCQFILLGWMSSALVMRGFSPGHRGRVSPHLRLPAAGAKGLDEHQNQNCQE